MLLKDYIQQIFCIYNNKLPITFILLKFIPFISQNFSKKYSFIRFILYRFLSVSLPIEFQELCQIPLRRQNWKSSVTAILYGIYYTMLYMDFNVDISFTTGFVVSFACNFFLTNYYTFKTKVDFENGVRFSICQAINFFMQYITLKVFIAIGVPEKVALIPVWAIIFPVNFWLMRSILRSDRFRLHLHKQQEEKSTETL